MDMHEILSQIPYLEIHKKKNRVWRIIIFLLFAALYLLFTLWLVSISFKLKEFARFGYLGVFIANLLASATILIPAPGWVATIAAGAILSPPLVALVASLGTAIGECTAYLLGYFGRATILKNKSPIYLKAESWVRKYGIYTVPVLSFLPLMPFDIVGIASGAMGLPFWKFIIAVWIGRFPRAIIESYFGAGLAIILRDIFFQ